MYLSSLCCLIRTASHPHETVHNRTEYPSREDVLHITNGVLYQAHINPTNMSLHGPIHPSPPPTASYKKRQSPQHPHNIPSRFPKNLHMRRNLPPMDHVPGPVLPTAVQMLHQPHAEYSTGGRYPLAAAPSLSAPRCSSSAYIYAAACHRRHSRKRR